MKEQLRSMLSWCKFQIKKNVCYKSCHPISKKDCLACHLSEIDMLLSTEWRDIEMGIAPIIASSKPQPFEQMKRLPSLRGRHFYTPEEVQQIERLKVEKRRANDRERSRRRQQRKKLLSQTNNSNII